MIRCCLCGCDATGDCVQRVDGAYCRACNNPPTISPLALWSLVAAGAVGVVAMVVIVTAVASVMP